MQSTSATWKGLLAAGNARLEARAVIGGAEYTQMTAPVIARALTQGGLSVGNVVSASCQLAVLASGSIPRAATVAVQMRLTDGTTASEWLPAGTFYISHRSRDAVNGLLTLTCYDALLKANAVWEPSAGSWPRNMSDVAEELRGLLGIPMDSRTAIPVGGLYVMNQPTAGATIRDVLGQIGQACGGNWIVTPGNALRLVPVVSAAGAAGAVENAIDVAGVTGSVSVGGTATVTGIRNTWEDVTDLVGSEDGLVLETQLVPALAAELGETVLGAAYQAYELGGAVYDPAAELGDYVRAGAGGEVSAVLCAETATLGPAFRGSLSAPEAGEMSDEYPYIGASQKALSLAKAYAKEAAADAVEGLDGELTQQEIFKRLTDNGAAQGLLLYNGQLYVNASYINTGELNADIIKGGTLTLGGANNVNGTIQVLDADGNDVGTITEDGAVFNSGAITSYSPDSNRRSNVSSGGFKMEGYLASESSSVVMWRPIFNVRSALGTVPENTTVYMSSGGNLEIYPGELNAVVIRGGNAVQPTPISKIVVYANGIVITGPVAFSGAVTLENPLDVSYGGTGATTPADARTNLGITPANIGAFGINSARGTITDANNTNLYGTRFFQANACANLPSNASGVYYHVEFMGTFQMAIEYAGENARPIYSRYFANNKWYSWQKIVDINTSGSVTVAGGGTGATNAAAARSNLGITPANIQAAYAINIASDVSGWSGIFQALNVLPTYTPGVIYAGSGPASKLTGGKLTSYINGVVTRLSDSVFDFMVQSGANPAYMYGFRVTGLTSSTGTPRTVYRFAGTAI